MIPGKQPFSQTDFIVGTLQNIELQTDIKELRLDLLKIVEEYEGLMVVDFFVLIYKLTLGLRLKTIFSC